LVDICHLARGIATARREPHDYKIIQRFFGNRGGMTE
jgi:hypothetical protein